MVIRSPTRLVEDFGLLAARLYHRELPVHRSDVEIRPSAATGDE